MAPAEALDDMLLLLPCLGGSGGSDSLLNGTGGTLRSDPPGTGAALFGGAFNMGLPAP